MLDRAADLRRPSAQNGWIIPTTEFVLADQIAVKMYVYGGYLYYRFRAGKNNPTGATAWRAWIQLRRRYSFAAGSFLFRVHEAQTRSEAAPESLSSRIPTFEPQDPR